jgi:hypothetical protein
MPSPSTLISSLTTILSGTPMASFARGAPSAKS